MKKIRPIFIYSIGVPRCVTIHHNLVGKKIINKLTTLSK